MHVTHNGKTIEIVTEQDIQQALEKLRQDAEPAKVPAKKPRRKDAAAA